MKPGRWFVLGAVVCGLGCPVTASLGRGGSAGGSSTGTGTDPSTSGLVSTSSGAAASETSSSSGTPDESSTTGSNTSSSSSDGDASTEDVTPEVCEGGGAQPCVTCLRAQCCDALVACFEIPLCACLAGCLESAPNFVSCLGIPACAGGVEGVELGTCAGSMCADDCGLM